MSKFLFFLYFILHCSSISAQDTTIIAQDPPKVESIKYTEKDIKIDAAPVTAKHFEKDFKNNYKGSDFVYEYKAPQKTWWNHFLNWLANIFRNLFHFKTSEAALDFVGILIRVIAVAVIVIVIYFIAKALINKEGKWIFGKDSTKKTIFYTDAEKNIHLLDFEKLIKESIAAGEKRIAVRYYYLWLLKVMAKNHYIEWDIEKTNSDYLYELQRPAHKEEFMYLSYLYNYIWYGEFEIDETTFLKTQNRFKNALKTFGNE